MLSNTNSLLIIAVIAIFAQTAYSHSCYTCNTIIPGKENCADPFNNDGIDKKDCNSKALINTIQHKGNSTGCMKSVSENKGVKSYVRDCYYGELNDKKDCNTYVSAVKALLTDDKITECNICTNDLCNGSSEITTMSVGAFLAILLVRNLF